MQACLVTLSAATRCDCAGPRGDRRGVRAGGQPGRRFRSERSMTPLRDSGRSHGWLQRRAKAAQRKKQQEWPEESRSAVAASATGRARAWLGLKTAAGVDASSHGRRAEARAGSIALARKLPHLCTVARCGLASLAFRFWPDRTGGSLKLSTLVRAQTEGKQGRACSVAGSGR